MPNLNSAEVLQLGEQTLNLPASGIAPKRASILGGRLSAVGLMRSDQLNALLVQPVIQGIAVIGSVTD